jgi:sugar phosphate isomerase/epimerase
MKFGFMTSAAPRWTLDQIIAAARADGYQAIEPRVEWGHAAGIELDLSKAERMAIKRQLDDAGLTISCLALGTRFARRTAAERADNVERTTRYAELAADLGAPLLRVFGGPVPEGTTVEAMRDAAAEALGEAARRTADFGVTPCLETHDDFKNPADVAYVVRQAGEANVGVVWHAVHHLNLGIPVADAYQMLKPWIRHCHLSEGAGPDQSQPPLRFGEGDGNVRDVIQTLRANNYQGAASWEWLNGRGDDYLNPEPLLAENAEQLREFVDED